MPVKLYAVKSHRDSHSQYVIAEDLAEAVEKYEDITGEAADEAHRVPAFVEGESVRESDLG